MGVLDEWDFARLELKIGSVERFRGISTAIWMTSQVRKSVTESLKASKNPKENNSNLPVSKVPVDGLAPLCAKLSAGKLWQNFGLVYKGPVLRGLNEFGIDIPYSETCL